MFMLSVPIFKGCSGGTCFSKSYGKLFLPLKIIFQCPPSESNVKIIDKHRAYVNHFVLHIVLCKMA